MQPRLGLNAGFQLYDFRWRRNVAGDNTAELAVNWLREQSSSFLMWYHTYDAHGPWEGWGGPCSAAAIDAERQRKIPLYQRLGELRTPTSTLDVMEGPLSLPTKMLG